MPLIDLQTNLKSLKYGADRLGGGDSGLPYIKKDINTADTGLKFDDGLVRGGAVNATIAGAVDTARIAKFLVDPPKGPLFLVKQIGLQLSNPRLEIPKNPANIASGLPDNVLAVGTNGLLEPTRIYNLGINTLAQVPVNAFGIHFNRHGILPVQTNASKYEAVVAANNDLGGSSKFNRLVGLTNKFKLGDRTPNTAISGRINRIANVINTVTQALNLTTGTSIKPIKTTPQDLIIDDYAAGPNSVYGIGRTTINRYSNTEDSFKIDLLTSFSKQYAGRTRDNNGAPTTINYFNDLGTGKDAIVNYDFGNGGIPFGDTSLVAGVDQNVVKYSLPSIGNPSIKTYAALKKQIDQQQKLKNSNNLSLEVSDSGEIVDVYVNQFGIYNTNTKAYSSTNVGKIGYKNPYGETVIINYSNWNAVSREQRVGSGRRDEINLTPIFSGQVTGSRGAITDQGNKAFGGDKVTINGEVHNIQDLVRFRIQAVDSSSPDNGQWMVFRAYLTDLSDDTTAAWNEVKYTGRGENFYVYNGFNRKINISFKVAALSVQEMQFIYQKLNYLIGNVMPDYNENNLMRGPLVRMSVGNWIDSQLGKLDSVSLKVPNDSPWEISLDDNLLILPHIVEVSLSFTPIGSETAGVNRISSKSLTTSHIAQNNSGPDSNTLQYIR